MRRVAKGVSWNFTGALVARGTSLVATLIVAGVLGSSRFGGLALVQTSVTTLGVASSLGLGLAITRFVAVSLERDRSRCGSYIVSALSLCTASGLLVVTAVLLWAPPFAQHVLGQPALATLLRIGSPALLIGPLIDAMLAGLSGLQRFRPLGGAQALRGILDGVGIVVGAIGGGPVGALGGYVLAEAITLTIAWLLLLREAHALGVDLSLPPRRAELRELVGFGVPALTASLLIQFAFWASQVILAHQSHGLELVGLFAIANRWYLAILFIPQTIEPILLPTLGSLRAAGNSSDFRRLVRSYVIADSAVVVPAALIVAFLGSQLTALLGHSYRGGDHILEILALASIPTMLNNILGQVAIALRRFGWWIFSDVALGTALLLAAVALIPSHKATGLAIAYLIGYSVTCLAIVPAFVTPVSAELARSDPTEPGFPLVAVSSTDLNNLVASTLRPQFPIAGVREHLRPLAVEAPTERTPRPVAGRRPDPAPAGGGQRRSSLAPAAGAVAVSITTTAIELAAGNGSASQYAPAVLGCAVTFFLVQAIAPRMRFRNDAVLCPVNWAWFLFATQLVLEPLLVLAFSPYPGQIRTGLPSPHAIQLAMLVSCLAYVGYAIGLGWRSRSPQPDGRGASWFASVPVGAVGVFIVLGTIGMVLRFHSVSSLTAYFTGQGTAATGQQPPTGIADAASTFLRPFGACGFILLWARSRASSGTKGQSGRLRLLGFGGAALVVLATYSYNRAAVVVPLIALVAAYGHNVRRISVRFVVVAGIVLLIGVVTFGNFRTIEFATQGGKISLAQANPTRPDLEEQIQVYGAAPQFAGLVVQHVDQGSSYLFGRSIPGSILAPLPVLGKPFRSSSGPILYNDLVYGTTNIVDQVLPFPAELYWNFGLMGVLTGFVLVGALVGFFQRRFDRSKNLLGAFIFQYSAMWVAFLVIGSLSVVSQIAIYFGIPIAVLWFFWGRGRRLHANVAGVPLAEVAHR